MFNCIGPVRKVLLVVAVSCISHVNAYELTTSTVDGDGAGSHNIIAVDRDNHFVHIVYFDETLRDLMHAVLDDSGGWQIQTIDDSPGSVFDLDLYVDTNGTAHVAYIKSGPELVYAERKGNLWSKRVIYNWINSWNQYLQVAVSADLQGHAYIVYHKDFNFLEMAYEDRDTPYPFTWTTLSGLSYRASWSGIDMDVIHAGTGGDPKVSILYRQYNANIIKLLTYDLSDSSWNEDTVIDFGPWFPGPTIPNANPPFSLSYDYANNNHHVGYLWVDDPTAGCFSCGIRNAYYVHSTGMGWSTPELVSVQGFPENIRYLSDIKITTTDEPVFAAVGANDPNAYYARKVGANWQADGTDDNSRSLHALQLDLDDCNNLHISAHDSLIPYDTSDDKLTYIAGVLDSQSNGCVIQPSQPPSGSPGFSSNSCKVVRTSYTERPRLDCDFFNLHAIAQVRICHLGGGSCSFHGAENAKQRSRAEMAAYDRVASNITEILGGSTWPSKSKIKDLKNSIEKMFGQQHLLNKETAATIDSLSDQESKDDFLHTLATLMHQASLAESIPEQVSVDVDRGTWVSADLNNIARLTMRDVSSAGSLTLDVVSEREEVKPPRGGSVLWPAAVYKFSFSGGQGKSGYTDINLNFSGLGYSDAEKVRIYEVGKGFIRDVTTQVDTERGIVSGRVRALGSYVLIEHL